MKEFFYSLCVIAFILLGFFIGRNTAKQIAPKPDIIIKRDTVWKEKPEEKETIPAGYELVPIGTVAGLSGEIEELKDSLERKPKIITKDSLVYVELPREEKIYEDSTFRAQISGFRPSLDWIQTYNTTITKIETIPPKRFNFSVTAGPAVIFDGKTIRTGAGVTIGLSYTIK